MYQVYVTGRSPQGERGLKWEQYKEEPIDNPSLPARGAWIEIPDIMMRVSPGSRRSPQGERGLKLDNHRKPYPIQSVAPRKGSVD